MTMDSLETTLINNEVASTLRRKNPRCVPVIVRNKSEFELKQCKFLCPKDETMGHLVMAIRKNMHGLTQCHSLPILVKDYMVCATDRIGSIDTKYNSDAGFLYVDVLPETTFG